MLTEKEHLRGNADKRERREKAQREMTRQLFLLRMVACTDGNVSLPFEILLASMPAYKLLGHMHSRGRYVNMLTYQTAKALICDSESPETFEWNPLYFGGGRRIEFLVNSAILWGNVLAKSRFSLGRFLEAE